MVSKPVLVGKGASIDFLSLENQFLGDKTWFVLKVVKIVGLYYNLVVLEVDFVSGKTIYKKTIIPLLFLRVKP